LSKGQKKSHRKRFIKWGLKLLLKSVFILVLLTVAQVAVLRYVDPPFTAAMACGWVKQKVFKKDYAWPQYEWRPLKEISPLLIKAVMAGEDQRFMSHNGFDFEEINQAAMDILRYKRIRGASTITMQVARSIFLWQGRSLLRKAIEAYYTILMEIFLDKVRIIELYLNVVDWGTGVIGAEAASQKYFHTSAANINSSQAAGMAAILPSPHKWSPTSQDSQVAERRKRILKDMPKMHL
jgi:monofunctional biosynthetic peptidoglycan transglycosylase